MQKLKSSILVFTISIILTFLFSPSCSTTDPPLERELKLELADVSSTEVWLQLTTANLQLPTTVNILKNNSVAQTYSLSTADTLLYIDSLLPNQSYKFKIAVNTTTNPQPTTNEVLAQTMDTTSHNFTWQTFTFGEHSSSTLYDVAIIDENNIWAVGEIYMLDSLGRPDPNAYNAVHWDGQSWELKRIKTLFRGNIITVPLEGIFAFSSTDIWMVGSLPIRGDGTNWTMYDLRSTVDPNLSLSKVWGSSSNDMYFVGNNGNIAHYQNGSWTKIESRTTTSIKDIWGIRYDDSSSFILCAVTNVASSGDRKILRINNNTVSDLLWDTGRRVQSVWFKNNYIYYACGGGVFSLKKNNPWKEITVIPLYYTEEIRGNNFNDVMVVGDFGLLAHFNGLSWMIFSNPTADIYYSCALTSNLVVTVGTKADQAIISIAYK